MANFKMGDVCTIVGAFSRADLIGRECTIVSALTELVVCDINGRWLDRIGYRVEIHGGTHRNPGQMTDLFGFSPEMLMKKQPPQEMATWQDVQSLTNWNPWGELAHV